MAILGRMIDLSGRSLILLPHEADALSARRQIDDLTDAARLGVPEPGLSSEVAGCGYNEGGRIRLLC
jgi:hypothetical protein